MAPIAGRKPDSHPALALARVLGRRLTCQGSRLWVVLVVGRGFGLGSLPGLGRMWDVVDTVAVGLGSRLARTWVGVDIRLDSGLADRVRFLVGKGANSLVVRVGRHLRN